MLPLGEGWPECGNEGAYRKDQPLLSVCPTQPLSSLFDNNLLLSRKEATWSFLWLKMCSKLNSSVCVFKTVISLLGSNKCNEGYHVY